MLLKLSIAILFLFTTVCYAATSQSDLGEFSNSYQRFGAPSTWKSPEERDAHHDHLYEMAIDKNSTVLKRYTYIILLGLNEADNTTRPLATKAAEILVLDPSLNSSDKQTVSEIRNLIALNQKNDPANKTSAASRAYDHSVWTNEHGISLIIDNINPTNDQIKARLLGPAEEVYAVTGFISGDIITFSAPSATWAAYISSNKMKAFWFAAPKSKTKAQEFRIGDSTFIRKEVPGSNGSSANVDLK